VFQVLMTSESSLLTRCISAVGWVSMVLLL
jgi:hypothetical protein